MKGGFQLAQIFDPTLIKVVTVTADGLGQTIGTGESSVYGEFIEISIVLRTNKELPVLHHF